MPSRRTQFVRASPRPVSAASHLRRKSRIWLPDALPSSLGTPCAAYASMNSYASSMAWQRAENSAKASSPGAGGKASSDDGVMQAAPGWLRPARRWVRDNGPALRLVMLEVLPPGNPAEEHRLGDPPLVGP